MNCYMYWRRSIVGVGVVVVGVLGEMRLVYEAIVGLLSVYIIFDSTFYFYFSTPSFLKQ